MALLDLPDDLLHSIFFYLTDDKDLHNVSKISFRWMKVANVVLKWKNKIRIDSFNLRNTMKWSSLDINSRKPSDRYGCAMLQKDDLFFVFGGATKSLTFFNDLWRFDLKRNVWKRMFGTGPIPIVRAFSCAGYDEKTLYFFGGCNGINMNRKWINVIDAFKLESNVWHSYQPTKIAPKQLVGQSNCCLKTPDNSRLTLFLFGGFSESDSRCAEREYFITLKSGECSLVNLRSEVRPRARCGSAIVSIDENRILVVGGFSSMKDEENLINDVWQLTRLSTSNENIHESTWEWVQIELVTPESPFCSSQKFYNSIALNYRDAFPGSGDNANQETVLILSITEDILKKQYGQMRSEKIDRFLEFLFKSAKDNKEMRHLAEKYSNCVLETTSTLMDPKEEQVYYRMTLHSLSLSGEKCQWLQPVHTMIDDPVWAPTARICFNAILTARGIFLFGGVPLSTENMDLEAQYRLSEKTNLIKNYFHKAIDFVRNCECGRDLEGFLSELFVTNKGATFSDLLVLHPRQFPMN